MRTERRDLRQLGRPVVAVLMATSVLGGLSVQLAGRNARPEHLAALAAIVVLALGGVLTRRSPWTINRFTALAAGWVAVNAVSSFFFSPDPWESGVHVVRLGLLAATFAIVAHWLRPDPAEWLWAFRIWLWLAAAQAAYGLATWVLAAMDVAWLPGARIVAGIPGISIEGTMYERNLFGILVGAATVAALYLLLAGTGRGRQATSSQPALVAIYVLCGGALIMALTRSAWMAVALVAPIAFGLARWRHGARPDTRLLLVLTAVPIGFAALTVFTPAPATAGTLIGTGPGGAPAGAESTASAFSERLATMAPGRVTDQRTVQTRLTDAWMAIDDFTASPIFGHGTGSFVMLHGIRAGSPAWISNMPLHTLVDTGLVGLAVQLGLVLAVIVGGWRASTTTRDPRLAVGLQALLLALLVVGIGYQVTDGSWLAAYWVHLGLIVHGIACVARERHVTDISV